MNKELSNFAARLREFIQGGDAALRRPDGSENRPYPELEFESLALELFALQFKHNPAYQKICEARRLTPEVIEHWTQIPAVPTAAFKELELTCLPPDERPVVFHSSGTTEQKPSRHYHGPESLHIYEASLLPWFFENVLPDLRFTIYDLRLVCLTPPPEQAPHSSLVHMFETVRRCSVGCPQTNAALGPAHATSTVYFGMIDDDGSWTLDFNAMLAALSSRSQPALPKRKREGGALDPRPRTPACLAEARARRRDPKPLLLLGTAFSFVHLLDFLEQKDLRFELPAGSRVMETGGYKNRSRSMPKDDLRALITDRLGIPPENIVCEYGMSELSSQAYDSAIHHPSSIIHHRFFQFPSWARAQVVSLETGREVAEGDIGLIRIFDLANVFSVMAIQSEDLGVRHGEGFELLGRAQLAEPRGCSLMMNEPLAPSLSPPGGERVAEGRVRG